MKKMIMIMIMIILILIPCILFAEDNGNDNWKLIAKKCQKVIRQTKTDPNEETYNDNLYMYGRQIIKYEVTLRERLPIAHKELGNLEELEQLEKNIEMIISNEIHTFGNRLSFGKEGRRVKREIRKIKKGRDAKLLPREVEIMIALGDDYDGLQAMLITSFMPSHPATTNSNAFIPTSKSDFFNKLINAELDFAEAFEQNSPDKNLESKL